MASHDNEANAMADEKEPRQDETLVIALEQLGQALDMMQGLFARIEAHMAESADSQGDRDEQAVLTDEVPDAYTLH